MGASCHNISNVYIAMYNRKQDADGNYYKAKNRVPQRLSPNYSNEPQALMVIKCAFQKHTQLLGGVHTLLQVINSMWQCSHTTSKDF